jgi:hypothetical protein
MPHARFPLGRILAEVRQAARVRAVAGHALRARFRPRGNRNCGTPGALAALQRNGENPFTFLARHQAGDWGEVDAHDRAENETSLKHGFRLLSAYGF